MDHIWSISTGGFGREWLISQFVFLMIFFLKLELWSNTTQPKVFMNYGSQELFFFKLHMTTQNLLFFPAHKILQQSTLNFYVESIYTNGFHLNLKYLKLNLFRELSYLYIEHFNLFIHIVISRGNKFFRITDLLEYGRTITHCSTRNGVIRNGGVQKNSNKDNTKRRYRGDMIQTHKMLTREEDIDPTKFFQMAIERKGAPEEEEMGVKREYDRMLEEHAKLQEQLKAAAGDGGSKKDE
ncbi:unnamed protein product, partial [Meganyctiphanes norvegica]